MHQATPPARQAAPWVVMVVAVLSAIACRLLAYSGFFGSDEVTYMEMALRPLKGDWTLDDYVGANRIGVNLPMTAFVAIFGPHEWAFALWSLLTSVAEVLLVCWAAWRVAGERAALWAGLLMATLPSHVHIAGRLLADAPLALCITAAFVLFLEAELRRWSTGYLLAGVAAGLSFLVKPVTLFVFAILLAYPLVERRWDWRWLWMVVGLVVTMAANGLAYMALTGRFWYVFETVKQRRSSGYMEEGITGGTIVDDPWFYPLYLFVKMYHTGLLGPLALAGWASLAFFPLRSAVPKTGSAGARFVVLWALGLITILSILPVSLEPLTFVPKQTNYILIFVAPLCVLGGIALAGSSRQWATLFGIAALVSSMVLALLLQASVAAFVANSRATLELVQARPELSTVHVMSQAFRAASFQRMVGGADLTGRLQPLSRDSINASTTERFVVIDEQTLKWDGSAPWEPGGRAPSCWHPELQLRGVPRSVGTAWAEWISAALPVAGPALRQRVLEVKPAILYRVPPGCID